MASELPEEPREREILLRALRDYSERCEPPGLTPDCPFSDETSESGVRACGEECMDLLGKHNAPPPSEQIDLGQGLSIRLPRRPRARRKRYATAKPYDAREIYLQDKASGRPHRWRLAAILYELIEVAQTPPPINVSEAAIRRDHIADLIRVTEGRGLRFEVEVLPVLRRHTAAAVLAHLHSIRRPFAHMSTWDEIVEEHLAASGSHSPDDLLMPIMTWALTANADDLLNWIPPASGFGVDPDPEIAESYEDGRWIVERFTKTYLRDWSVPALRKEWLYLHGQHPAPCLPLEMGVREIPEAKLAMEMADRLANPPPDRHFPELAQMLVEPALSFLQEGRRTEAAALFEAALRYDRNSPDALNNLGFCLLPDHPDQALRYFEEAATSGRGDIELINVNRMLALTLVGRKTSALDLASTHLRSLANRGPRLQTWLWDIHSVLPGNEPKLIECNNFKEYVHAIQATITNGGEPTA